MNKKEINYNKLRTDVLQKLVAYRELECKDNRTDMIRHLLLDDEGKYIRETIVDKIEKDKYVIGIDIARGDLLIKMGRLIEKGDAKFSHYANCRRYYYSNINILEDEME